MHNITANGIDKISFKKIKDKYYRLSLVNVDYIVHDSFCNSDMDFIVNMRELLDHLSNARDDVLKFYIKCNYRGKNNMIFITCESMMINITYPTMCGPSVHHMRFVADTTTILTLEDFVKSL